MYKSSINSIGKLTLVDHQGWDLLKRIDPLVLLTVLLTPVSDKNKNRQDSLKSQKEPMDYLLDKVYRLHIDVQSSDVEGDPDSPSA